MAYHATDVLGCQGDSIALSRDNMGIERNEVNIHERYFLRLGQVLRFPLTDMLQGLQSTLWTHDREYNSLFFQVLNTNNDT